MSLYFDYFGINTFVIGAFLENILRENVDLNPMYNFHTFLVKILNSRQNLKVKNEIKLLGY